MSKFSALPVGKGDAFLWRPGDRAVLVDGGQSTRRAHAALKSKNIHHLNAIVCTHGDSDHWKGLLPIIKDASISIDEVWVPARWGDGLKDLATDPMAVLDQLLLECSKSKLKHLSDDAPAGDPAVEAPEEEHDLAEVEEAVACGPDLTELLAAAEPMGVGYPFPLHALAPAPPALWLEAVQVLGGIWEVVRESLHRGALLRWFKYGEGPVGGHDWLYPVNSAEMLRVQRTTGVLRWLALTLKNKEALVLVGDVDDEPPVLFCSDSDLSFDLEQKVPKTDMLVTAPHHGSPSNAAAYAALQQHHAATHTWVRSDFKPKKPPQNGGNPCKEFTNISMEHRACTACHRCGRALMAVEAEVVAGRWAINQQTCPK